MKKLLLIFTFLLLVLLNINAQQIKIITYNIRYNNTADGINSWPLRKAKVDTLLKQYPSNIWCFQEVLNNQLVDLKTMLPNYSYIGVGRDDGKENGEYSPIFYSDSLYVLVKSGTFWLSPTPSVIGSKGWDAAITRICTWVQLKDKQTDKLFFVFNTHFDHQGELARNESAKLILNKTNELGANFPILIVGDFNSEPNSNAYKTIINNKSNPFYDSHQNQKDNCTFTGFKVNAGICKHIDFIFFNKHFKLRKYFIISQNDGLNYPSDHLPVLSLFKMK